MRYRVGERIRTCDVNCIKERDPRKIGPNPKILEYLQLYPKPNDFTAGDGLSRANFTFAAPINLDYHLGSVRLDHTITSRWNANIKFTANREIGTDAGQIDLQKQIATSSYTQRPRNAVASLIWAPAVSITNEARFSWLHHRQNREAVPPHPVAGLEVVMRPDSNYFDDLISSDPLSGRRQSLAMNRLVVTFEINNLT